MDLSIWPERVIALQGTAQDMEDDETWLTGEQVKAVTKVASSITDALSEVKPFALNGLVQMIALMPLGIDGLNPDANIYLVITNAKAYQYPTLTLGILSYPKIQGHTDRQPTSFTPDRAAELLDKLAASLSDIPGLKKQNVEEY